MKKFCKISIICCMNCPSCRRGQQAPGSSRLKDCLVVLPMPVATKHHSFRNCRTGWQVILCWVVWFNRSHDIFVGGSWAHFFDAILGISHLDPPIFCELKTVFRLKNGLKLAKGQRIFLKILPHSNVNFWKLSYYRFIVKNVKTGHFL